MSKEQNKDLSRRVARLEAASAARKQTATVGQSPRRLSKKDKAELDARMGLNTEPAKAANFDGVTLRLGVAK